MPHISGQFPVNPIHNFQESQLSGLENLSQGPLFIINQLPSLYLKTWSPNADPTNNQFIQICRQLVALFASISQGMSATTPPNFFVNILDLNGMGSNSQFVQFDQVFNGSFFNTETNVLDSDLNAISANQNSSNPMLYIQNFINDASSAFTNAFKVGSSSAPCGFTSSIPSLFLPIDPDIIQMSMQKSSNWSSMNDMFCATILLISCLNAGSQASATNELINILSNEPYPLSNTIMENFFNNYFLPNLPTY